MAQKTLLSDTPENLIHKYYQVLRNNNVSVEQIILFGSHAKKEFSNSSDVDICVVSKSFGDDSFSEMIDLSKLAVDVDPLIEPHPYNPKDLQNKWDSLAQEITKHGIRII